ncbi:hypothetical protein GCM10010413_56760 [Promicromonospora sukumoe]
MLPVSAAAAAMRKTNSGRMEPPSGRLPGPSGGMSVLPDATSGVDADRAGFGASARAGAGEGPEDVDGSTLMGMARSLANLGRRR